MHGRVKALRWSVPGFLLGLQEDKDTYSSRLMGAALDNRQATAEEILRRQTPLIPLWRIFFS